MGGPPDAGMNTVNQGVVMRSLAQLLRNESGASAIEYALVASLIAVAAYAAIANLGARVDTMFNNVSNNMPSS
jgi:pilus assembly protein Flp/PilA